MEWNVSCTIAPAQFTRSWPVWQDCVIHTDCREMNESKTLWHSWVTGGPCFVIFYCNGWTIPTSNGLMLASSCPWITAHLGCSSNCHSSKMCLNCHWISPYGRHLMHQRSVTVGSLTFVLNWLTSAFVSCCSHYRNHAEHNGLCTEFWVALLLSTAQSTHTVQESADHNVFFFFWLHCGHCHTPFVYDLFLGISVLSGYCDIKLQCYYCSIRQSSQFADPIAVWQVHIVSESANLMIPLVAVIACNQDATIVHTVANTVQRQRLCGWRSGIYLTGLLWKWQHLPLCQARRQVTSRVDYAP